MDYKVEKVEGRPEGAPKKFKVSVIDIVKDENGKDVRIPRFIGNPTLEHLEEMKAGLQKQIAGIDEQIKAIKKVK